MIPQAEDSPSYHIDPSLTDPLLSQPQTNILL